MFHIPRLLLLGEFYIFYLILLFLLPIYYLSFFQAKIQHHCFLRLDLFGRFLDFYAGLMQKLRNHIQKWFHFYKNSSFLFACFFEITDKIFEFV